MKLDKLLPIAVLVLAGCESPGGGGSSGGSLCQLNPNHPSCQAQDTGGDGSDRQDATSGDDIRYNEIHMDYGFDGGWPDTGPDPDVWTEPDESCVPDCFGMECGSNGCGGVCGTCDAGWTCVEGMCQETCVADCTGAECGSDGCGGSCGTCGTGEYCDGNGICRAEAGGGACTNASDQHTMETVDVENEAINCAFSCMQETDPATCSSQCIAEATGLSAGCSGCFGVLIGCIFQNCLMDCTEPESPACMTCREETCGPPFESCAGIAP